MRTLILIIFCLFAGAEARADFFFACGKNRDKGAERAEIGFTSEQDSLAKLYVNGQEMADEKVGIKATDDGTWIVGLDRGAGHGSAKYVFSIKGESVQEFSISEKGDEKKVGPKKPCRYEHSEETPAAE